MHTEHKDSNLGWKWWKRDTWEEMLISVPFFGVVAMSLIEVYEISATNYIRLL